jgi:hypothetical protein
MNNLIETIGLIILFILFWHYIIWPNIYASFNGVGE